MGGTLMGGTLWENSSIGNNPSQQRHGGSSGLGGQQLGRHGQGHSFGYAPWLLGHQNTGGQGGSTGSPGVTCPDSSVATNSGSGAATDNAVSDVFTPPSPGRHRHVLGQRGLFGSGGGALGGGNALTYKSMAVNSAGNALTSPLGGGRHAGSRSGQLAYDSIFGGHRTPQPPSGSTPPPPTVGATGTPCPGNPDPCITDPASCNLASNDPPPPPQNDPEPGTLALVAVALGGVAWMRRRSTKKTSEPTERSIA